MASACLWYRPCNGSGAGGSPVGPGASRPSWLRGCAGWVPGEMDIHSLLAWNLCWSCLWPRVAIRGSRRGRGCVRKRQQQSFNECYSFCLPLELQPTATGSGGGYRGSRSSPSGRGELSQHCCLLGAASEAAPGSSWLPFALLTKPSWVCPG